METETKPLYKKNRHACYDLQYHIILITKYRNPILKDNVKDYIYSLIRTQAERNKVDIITMSGEPDHIHLMVDAPPQVCLADFINVIKTNTARLTRRDYPDEVKKYYWKKVFWSDSYFVATVSDRTKAMVKSYIDNQKG